MLGFARRSATGAPPGSPLLLLLDAHLEMMIGLGMRGRQSEAVDYMRRLDVAAEVPLGRGPLARALAYRLGPNTPLDRNLAAFWLVEVGDHEGARAQFEQLGDVVTEHLWRYFDEPARFFADYQAVAMGRRRRPGRRPVESRSSWTCSTTASAPSTTRPSRTWSGWPTRAAAPRPGGGRRLGRLGSQQLEARTP